MFVYCEATDVNLLRRLRSCSSIHPRPSFNAEYCCNLIDKMHGSSSIRGVDEGNDCILSPRRGPIKNIANAN